MRPRYATPDRSSLPLCPIAESRPEATAAPTEAPGLPRLPTYVRFCGYGDFNQTGPTSVSSDLSWT